MTTYLKCHKVSYMDKQKFSIMPINPVFKEGIGNMGVAERDLIHQAVIAYKKGQVIEFLEHVHKNQWEYFNEQTKGIEGEVQLWGPIPDNWSIDNKKHIKIFNRCVYSETIKALNNREQYRLQYKRVTSNLDKHFLMTYGSKREHERECVVQTLERLNVLNNSIYSRPAMDEQLQKHVDIDYIFPIRNHNVRYCNIENTTQILTNSYLYDQDKTLPVLYEASQRVQCWAVLDCFPFNNNLNGVPSEKFIWPVLMGVPFIYIGNRQQKEVLKSWGFEPNDSSRDDVRGTVEQMMWLKSIFDDPELSQQWQESQGNLVIKNSEVLKILPNKILSIKNTPA